MAKATEAVPSTDEAAVKIACRNVWKVYGSTEVTLDPARIDAASSSEQVSELKQTLLDEGHIVAACDVSFDVRVGEIFVIMGLSGSGKSTMVRCLSRLVEPTSGEVLLDGSDLLKVSDRELIEIRRHRMGMVFQNFGLLPHLTVLENICFPLKLQGVSKQARRARAAEVISLVGLDGRDDSFPRELSGGQQQRVGLARSLAVEPELWFLDEPFSALDPLIRRQMQDEFLRLQTMLHKTIVFITHDFLEALRLADRIAIMKDGEVVQIGTPTQLVLNPANEYVAEFTKDVPRDKLITAGEIAVATGEPAAAATVSSEMSLDQLMPLFAQHPNGLDVTQGDQIIGTVTAQSVVEALAASAGKSS